MTIRRSLTALCVALAASAPALAADGTEATRTGWFADQNCSTSRAEAGRTGPPGRSCTQECIRKGVPVVFIDEKTKTLFRVSNPGATRGQECDHVQVTGTLDEKARTIRVVTIKVLDPYVARCDAK